MFYIAIHQVSLLSHAASASMSTTTSTTTTTRDGRHRYGPKEWAQKRERRAKHIARACGLQAGRACYKGRLYAERKGVTDGESGESIEKKATQQVREKLSQSGVQSG